MANYFEFNYHKSSEYGLIVNGVNIFNAPNRIVDKISIPYRNGDLLIDTGVYSNIIVSYTVSLLDPSRVRDIAKWLLRDKGYQRLEDTYTPTEFRMASYYSDINYQMTMLYRYGQATISFDCKPQRYLKSGETSIEFTEDGYISNDTGFDSQPLITIYGDGTLGLEGQTITTTNNTNNWITIDCETMQCYRYNDSMSQNVTINTANRFPVIWDGGAEITLEGITKADITPRWWRL